MQRLTNWILGDPRIFDAIRRIPENGFKAHRNVIRVDLPADCGRILDLGCGTGEFCSNFAQQAYVGLDVSAEYISYAKQKYKGDFLVGQAQCLGVRDCAFSCILVIGLFHHLPDDQVILVLREMQRVVEVNGTILVMEDIPTVSSWNWVGKLIHRFDQGAFIRKHKEYELLFADFFGVRKTYPMRSGVCDYQVYVLVKPGGYEFDGQGSI